MPITVLTIPEMFQRLLQLNSPPLNIELVEPASFFSLSDPVRQRVSCALQQLTARGHRIWLDDIDEASGQAFLSCRLPLCGIKIDKIAFWRLRETPALTQLVTLCSKLLRMCLLKALKQNGTVHARFMLARASVRDIIGHHGDGRRTERSSPRGKLCE